jgi:ABC-type glycerol-3-phosphate transport system permease component
MHLHYIELVPAVLAVLTAVLCAYACSHVRRRRERTVMTLGVICSLFYIVAQTSWWTTTLAGHNGVGEEINHLAWALFHSLVMLTFLVMSLPRLPKAGEE